MEFRGETRMSISLTLLGVGAGFHPALFAVIPYALIVVSSESRNNEVSWPNKLDVVLVFCVPPRFLNSALDQATLEA